MPLTKTGKKAPTTERRNNERDFNGLVLQLDDPRPTARRWAVRDLAAYPDAYAVLLEYLVKEQDGTVLEGILTNLIAIGTIEVVDGLLPMLRSQDAKLRNSIIEALQQMPEAVGKRMEALLQDPDPDVRIFAINVLQTLRHDHAPQWLHSVILADAHVNVCATAIDVLAEVGTPEMIPDLQALVDRFPDEAFIAYAVGVAARQIQCPR